MDTNKTTQRHRLKLFIRWLFVSLATVLFPLMSQAQERQLDGDYTLRVYRVWSSDHLPNLSDPFYSTGKTELLYSVRFSVLDHTPSATEIVDHTNADAQLRNDLQISMRGNDTIRVSATINTQIGVVGLGSFAADFLVADGNPSVISQHSSGLRPNYNPLVTLARRAPAGPRTSSTSELSATSSRQVVPPTVPSTSAPSSSADRVRLAQTILAEMNLYTSTIDGVAGSGTNRALAAAMQQMNSTTAPTVENFLRVAVGRMRTVDQPAAVSSNLAELSQLRTQNASLTSQLDTARGEVAAAAVELSEGKSALAAALVATGAGNADASAKQETVAALEVRVAELSAALEQAQAGLRSNDAANATIADLREELEALRPLTAQLDTLTEQSNSLQRQISAANETVADLRDGIASDERVGELQRQLDAANATVANLRDDIIGSYVPVADYVNLQRQVSALTATNAEMRERVQADFVPRAEYAALEVSSRDAQDALRSQLAAANQTVAELRERMNSAYVPVADHVELQRQLAAASATNTELRETMRSDYVSRADFLVAQRILAATNESMVDLRRAIETQFMPLDDYQRLERQLSALNSTILELQDRNEIQRNRMVESEALFRNFREDCAAVPECARAMRLEGLSP